MINAFSCVSLPYEFLIASCYIMKCYIRIDTHIRLFLLHNYLNMKGKNRSILPTSPIADTSPLDRLIITSILAS